MVDGRVGKPTGLSQAEPQEGLGPTGFDPSRKAMQPVYDLIIEACEHSPRFHARGAAAMREIDRLLAERRAFRTQAVNRGWNWNLCNAYGRVEYQRHLENEVDQTLEVMLGRKTLVQSFNDSPPLLPPCDSDGSPEGGDALAASSETTARAEGIAETPHAD